MAFVTAVNSTTMNTTKTTRTKQDQDAPKLNGRILSARPDSIDFRDKMYTPNLVEVPETRPLEHYLAGGPNILDQGQEGACTGFALAAIANHLLRTRIDSPSDTLVSERMLYEMARRNDEWDGENYSGSSARGAMKGWHKHGVCSQAAWPYIQGQTTRNRTCKQTKNRI